MTAPSTLHDVAAAARVSPSTASRVLSGARDRDDELARRVRTVAEQLGYSANVVARGMRSRQNTVAVFADDVGTETMGEIVYAMEHAARAAGSLVTVTASGGDPVRQLESFRALSALRPRAVVLTGSWLDRDSIQEKLQRELDVYVNGGGRVVIIGQPRAPFPSIGFNDYASALLVGEHMAGLDRTDALILSGPPDHAAFLARTQAFRLALESAGISNIRQIPSAMTREAGATAMRVALAGGAPSLVLAGNDVIAFGALAELRRRGFRVPEDVAVSGFDGIPFSLDEELGITTVALPFAQLGKLAAAIALSNDAPERQELSGSLIVRGTTRRR